VIDTVDDHRNFLLTHAFYRTQVIIGCVQQTKQISEHSVILYYDWFVHLNPAKNQRQESIILKNHWLFTDLLCLLTAKIETLKENSVSSEFYYPMIGCSNIYSFCFLSVSLNKTEKWKRFLCFNFVSINIKHKINITISSCFSPWWNELQCSWNIGINIRSRHGNNL